MSTTVSGTNSTNYTNTTETSYENGPYQAPEPSLGSNSKDIIENEDKIHFKPAPAKIKDHKPKFKAAPAKVKDYSTVSTNSSSSENKTNSTSNSGETSNTQQSNNATIDKEKLEKSNEEAKNAGKSVSNYSGSNNILNSEPSFILSRFRSGDPELFKLLSDPALGPVLMAKIQDAAAAETRMHTLLSNLQKAKDDTLKAIVNNIR